MFVVSTLEKEIATTRDSIDDKFVYKDFCGRNQFA